MGHNKCIKRDKRTLLYFTLEAFQIFDPGLISQIPRKQTQKSTLEVYLLWPHHRVDGLDNPGHLRKIDPPVAVGIIHAEQEKQSNAKMSLFDGKLSFH